MSSRVNIFCLTMLLACASGDALADTRDDGLVGPVTVVCNAGDTQFKPLAYVGLAISFDSGSDTQADVTVFRGGKKVGSGTMKISSRDKENGNFSFEGKVTTLVEHLTLEAIHVTLGYANLGSISHGTVNYESRLEPNYEQVGCAFLPVRLTF